MKCDKAAGTSSIGAELLKASKVESAQQIRDLIEDIIHFGKSPTEWDESIIVSLYKGKCVTLEPGNYQGLKLLDQLMKALERVGRIFYNNYASVTCSLPSWTQHHTRHIHCTLVAREVLCRQQDKVHGLCRLGKGIPLCSETCHLMGSSQARSGWVDSYRACINYQKQRTCRLRPKWRVQCERVCSQRILPEPPTVHHGSGSPLTRVSYRCPRENLYADDRVIITESLEELQKKLILLKITMDGKGLRVNMGKTKVLISGPGPMCFRSPAKTPVSCVSRVPAPNSIFCCWLFQLGSQEMQWYLWPDPSFRGKQWTGQARPPHGRPMTGPVVGRSLRWCHLSLSLGTTYPQVRYWTRCYHEMSHRMGPIQRAPASRSFPITSRGRVYNSCVRSAMLHASETWTPPLSDLRRLQRNDRAMIHWMYGVTSKDQDQVSSQDILERTQFDELAKVLPPTTQMARKCRT